MISKLSGKKSQAFTLIELLVVISIIIVLSGVAVSSWRKGTRAMTLQRTAQKIVQDIRRAQNMAMSSREYEGEVPEGYGIYFTDKSYTIFADNGNDHFDGSDFVVESFSLEENDIVIESLFYEAKSVEKLSIVFIPPDPETIIKGRAWGVDWKSGDSGTIKIQRTGGTCPDDCKTIIVKDTGQITIE